MVTRTFRSCSTPRSTAWTCVPAALCRCDVRRRRPCGAPSRHGRPEAALALDVDPSAEACARATPRRGVRARQLLPTSAQVLDARGDRGRRRRACSTSASRRRSWTGPSAASRCAPTGRSTCASIPRRAHRARSSSSARPKRELADIFYEIRRGTRGPPYRPRDRRGARRGTRAATHRSSSRGSSPASCTSAASASAFIPPRASFRRCASPSTASSTLSSAGSPPRSQRTAARRPHRRHQLSFARGSHREADVPRRRSPSRRHEASACGPTPRSWTATPARAARSFASRSGCRDRASASRAAPCAVARLRVREPRATRRSARRVARAPLALPRHRPYVRGLCVGDGRRAGVPRAAWPISRA